MPHRGNALSGRAVRVLASISPTLGLTLHRLGLVADRCALKLRLRMLAGRGYRLERYGERIQVAGRPRPPWLDRWIDDNRRDVLEALPDKLPRSTRRRRPGSGYWSRSDDRSERFREAMQQRFGGER